MASTQLREFLVSRRAQVDPTAAGLPPSPVPRRRPGLRREEVAVLAGVSVDYYARLEQGRAGRVSDQVLTAVEDALGLDPLEREHLRSLVHAQPGDPAARPARAQARPTLRRVVAALDPAPAFVQSRAMDVLAWNGAAATLLTDFGAMPPHERNIARWLFLTDEGRSRYAEWEKVAGATVASLRATLDPRSPDPALTALVADLRSASADFARLWADYRLFRYTHGTKLVVREGVGTLRLTYETLEVPGSDGQTLCVYTAEPGSPSERRLAAVLAAGDATA